MPTHTAAPLHAATRALLQADAWRMACLRTVAGLGLADWYIAAGFVRNLVWDRLHDYGTATPLNDVDVVFFDANDGTTAQERRFEAQLAGMMPDVGWQVRNQARMHRRNGHAPYADALDAIAHFPELPTCIGVRLDRRGALQVDAPHGIGHNWDRIIRANRVAAYPRSVIEKRAQDKQWLRTWPLLRLAPPDDG